MPSGLAAPESPSSASGPSAMPASAHDATLYLGTDGRVGQLALARRVDAARHAQPRLDVRHDSDTASVLRSGRGGHDLGDDGQWHYGQCRQERGRGGPEQTAVIEIRIA